MERVGRRVRGAVGEVGTVAVSVAPLPLPGTARGRTRARPGRAERWGEWTVIGVTLLLVSVLFAGVRHAVATSPVVPAPPGRMVFVPLVR